MLEETYKDTGLVKESFDLIGSSLGNTSIKIVAILFSYDLWERYRLSLLL